MFKTIADFLVPTERNQNLPYALSPAAYVVYFVLAIVLMISPAYVRHLQLATLGSPAPFTARDIINLANSSRAAVNISALEANPALSQVAEDKARDILNKQYFAHVNPDGKTPWEFLRGRSYVYIMAGENLAMDFASAEEVNDGFMSSPTHRANILNPMYTEIGVAVEQGIYEGRPSIVVVQYFGRPKPEAAKTVAAASQAAVPTLNPKPVVPPPPSVPTPKEEPKTRTTVVNTPLVIGETSGPIMEKETEENGDKLAPASSTAVAVPTIVTTTEAVLGAEAADFPAPPIASACTQTAFGMSWSCTGTRSVALMIFGILIISLVSLIVKTGGVPWAVGVRTAVLLVVVGYVSLRGLDPAITPHTTTEALALIELL